jgi:hypothetical protein
MSQNDGYSPLIYVNNLFNYLTAFCQSKNITDYSTRFKQITSNVTVGEMRGKIAIVIRPGDDDRWRYQYDEAGILIHMKRYLIQFQQLIQPIRLLLLQKLRTGFLQVNGGIMY